MSDTKEKQAAIREFESDARNRGGIASLASNLSPDDRAPILPPPPDAPITTERLIMGIGYGLAMGVCGIGNDLKQPFVFFCSCKNLPLL